MTQKVRPSTLADTTVSLGTYGGSTQQAVFTVDAQGRLTYAANATPSVANTNITGLITNSQIASVANTKVTGTIPYSQISGITGEIKMWPVATAPTGFFNCDGSAYSRTTYAALFSVIGTTFGSGDGSTTFNVPDFRNRSPFGSGDTYSLNSKGGSKDAVVVSHSHSLSTATLSGTTGAGGKHIHAMGDYSSNNGRWGYYAYSGASYPSGTGTFWNGSGGGSAGGSSAPTSGSVVTSAAINMNIGQDHTHTFSGATISGDTSTVGSSGTNANLPPYIGINFIIRHDAGS